ncbi:MAG TPA: hypothetical protein VD837_06985 [Terriglobales bacterium]|nr:hypothetical protein [Terriglobales bacterium]
MKTLRTYWPLYIPSLCLLLAALGCAVFDKNATPAEKAIEIQWLAEDAASLGTEVSLITNPQYRPAFEAAYAELNRLVESEQPITLVSLQKVLATLPIDKLKGKEAEIGIRGSRLVLRRLIRGEVEENIQLYSRHAAIGMRDGIGGSL